MIVLHSPGLGALSLLPNAIPGLMAFGLWGLFVGEIGIGVSTVAARS